MAKYETETGPTCCNCFGKVVCSVIVAILLLVTAGLSAVSVLLCRYQYWTYVSDGGATPPYTLRTGFYEFTKQGGGLNVTSLRNATDTYQQLQDIQVSGLIAAGNPSLRDINWALWIIGVICMAALAFSTLAALVYFLLTLCACAGGHMGFLGVPLGIILLGMMLCYYFAALITVRDYTGNTVNHRYNTIPDFGWIFGIAAAILWFIVSGTAACVPMTRRHKHVVETQPHGAMTGPPPARYDPETGRIVQ